MLICSKAVFFDAISSVPVDTDIIIDSNENEISFLDVNAIKQVWLLKEISYQIFDQVLILKNKQNVNSYLKVDNQDFKTEFLTYLNQKANLNPYHNFLAKGPLFHLVIVLFLLAIFVLSYIYALPIVAEKSVVLIPESFDEYLGAKFMLDYVSKNKIDSIKTANLNQFAKKIILSDNRTFKFTVVESAELNAFALPDGHIVVFSALIDQIESYDELACLLAHEAVHVNNRHALKMLSRNIAGYLLVSIAFSDANAIMAVIADNAHNLNSLSYSRKFEKEADEKGVQLMILNRIDPNGMIRLFERLQKIESFVLPEFKSSHPITEERKKNIEKLISNQQIDINSSNIKLQYYFQKLKTEN